jgi:hypothetical protein
MYLDSGNFGDNGDAPCKHRVNGAINDIAVDARRGSQDGAICALEGKVLQGIMYLTD